MIALTASEFMRIRSRRLVWVLLILLLLGIVIAAVLVAAHSTRPAPGEFAPPGSFALATLPQALQSTAFLLIVFGLVVGASSVGADWQAGSMTTLLTWEPRRTRVFVIRLLVVAGFVFVSVVILEAVLSLALALVAATRGSTSGTDSAWMGDVIKTALRIGAMGVLGTCLGISVSMLGRTTAASLGAVFVYLAVLESIVRALVPSASPWLLGPNVVVFVEGIASSPGTQQTLSFVHAVGVTAAYALMPLVVAAVAFRGRDVT